MIYHVIVPKKAQRELEKINNPYRPKILAAFATLANDPYRGKKLKRKYVGVWSYRVWPYRILYRIKNRTCIILILRIGHRKNVY